MPLPLHHPPSYPERIRLCPLPGVSDVNVDLEKGEATWKESQPLDIAEVKKAINKLGFEA